MIDGQRVGAIVPARGGSTTVPDKNVRDLGGEPLLTWTIEVARATEQIDRVDVSTDAKKIAEVADEGGAGVIERPPEIATDDALVMEAVRHVLEQWKTKGEEIDLTLLLEPTCPFRRPHDVRACLDRLTGPGEYDSVATFTKAAVNPHRTWQIEKGRPYVFVEGADPWRPRQEQPQAYQLNGAVYGFFTDRLPPDADAPLFGRKAAVRMPRDRSIDIDTEVDLAFANYLVSQGHVTRDGALAQTGH